MDHPPAPPPHERLAFSAMLANAAEHGAAGLFDLMAESPWMASATPEELAPALLSCVKRDRSALLEKILSSKTRWGNAFHSGELIRDLARHTGPEALACLDLLARAGAPLDIADPKKAREGCALGIACQQTCTDMLEKLLELGASPNGSRPVPNASFPRPLEIAILNHQFAHVNLLLKAGADPNLLTSQGRTNLSTLDKTFVKDERFEFAESLLLAGARIDQENRDGWPPLHLAVANGDLSMIEFLLARGADPALLSNNFAHVPAWNSAIFHGQSEAALSALDAIHPDSDEDWEALLALARSKCMNEVASKALAMREELQLQKLLANPRLPSAPGLRI